VSVGSTELNRLRAVFPIFPGAEELDLAGPWEALTLAQADLELCTVALRREPVRLRGGLRVVPDHTFGSEPEADLIVVPGGPGTRDETAAAPVAAWLGTRSDTPLLTSVCTGAFLLAAAGLLDGRRATTHHRWFDAFAERFPDVELVRDSRVVDDGEIVTAGGVTSGIDLGLYLVARLFGGDVSAEVASVMEYPSPNTPAAASSASRSGA
jgi:transcriptional regulator GlxA family with amidase domain